MAKQKRKRPKATSKAKRLAKQKNRKLVSEAAVYAFIRKKRNELRVEGKSDRCRDLAILLNNTSTDSQKWLRNWYQHGQLNFTKWGIRDIWFRQTGRDWSAWKKPRGEQQLIPWSEPSGPCSKNAVDYCEANPRWTPILPNEFVTTAKRLFLQDGLTTQQIANRLNKQKRLRPFYTAGAPSWTQSEVSRCFSLINVVGLNDLPHYTKERQSPSNIKSVVVKKHTAPKVPLVAKTAKAPKGTRSVHIVTIDAEAFTATVKITEFVPKEVIKTLPLNDPLVGRAIENGLHENKRKN